MRHWFGWGLAAVLLSGCGACIDLEAERPYRCSVDAGEEQCPDGWRCGLDGRCHSQSVASDYQCQSDTDCEGGWRCGPDRRCVDVEADSLKPTPTNAAYHVQHVGPDLLDRAPEHLAISPAFDLVDTCGEERNSNVAFSWVLDGGFTKVVLSYDGYLLVPDGGVASDGGALCDVPDPYQSPTHFALQDTARAPLPGGSVRAMADLGKKSFLAMSSGAFCSYDWAFRQGVTGPTCAANAFGFAPTQLRISGHPPYLVAFDSQRYAVYNAATGTVFSGGTLRNETGVAQTINDIAPSGARYSDRSIVYAATTRGIFAAEYVDGGMRRPDGTAAATPWLPYSLPNFECDKLPVGAPKLFEPLRIRTTADGRYLMVPGRDLGNQQDFLSIKKHGPDDGGTWDGLCPYAPSPFTGHTYNTDIRQRHPPCDSARVQDFHVVQTSDSTLRLEFRCATADGGSRLSQTVIHPDDANPDYQNHAVDPNIAPLYARPWVTQNSNPQSALRAGELGHLWWNSEYPTSTATLTLDRPPSAVFGTADSLFVTLGDVVTDRNTSQELNILRGETFLGERGASLAPLQKDDFALPFLSGVEGRPRWALFTIPRAPTLPPFVSDFGNRVLPLPDIRARISISEQFLPPYRGAMATRGDGTEVLLISSLDALLAGEVPAPASPYMDIAQVPPLTVKLVPLARGPITSLTALTPGSNAAPTLVHGYLIASSRLFRFQTTSAKVWRSDEVFLPDGDPLKVFSDGEAGRVGFVDGRVFALPSRVPIAPPLPSGVEPAVDFAHVCSQIYALTRGGVFRLSADGATPEGTWIQVSADDAWLKAGGVELNNGQLYSVETDLFVFSPNGRAVRINDLGCP